MADQLLPIVQPRPCAFDGSLPPCPWRRDSIGYFPHVTSLNSAKVQAMCGTPGNEVPLHGGVFICHKSHAGQPRRICAGWLATVGVQHLGMRLAVALNQLDGTRLAPEPGWPELFADHHQMVTSHGLNTPDTD